MVFDKKRKSGRHIEQLKVGDSLKKTEKIEDKDLLLYLGLSNDNNPLYIQHDYASLTPYGKPIVPASMLTGIVLGTISREFPGPGAHVIEHQFKFPKPVFHYATLDFEYEITQIDENNHEVTMDVKAVDEAGELVVEGTLGVCPPFHEQKLTSKAFGNF